MWGSGMVGRWSRKLVAGLTLVAFTGCAAEISYGVRPLGRPAVSVAERCFEDRSLQVTTGTAEVQWSEAAGPNITREVTEYRRGLVFYRGGTRLDPTTTLRILNDRELQHTYGRKLDRLESRYKRSRNSMIIGNLGLVGATVGLLAYSSSNGDGPATEQDKHVLLGLAGVGLISIPLLIFGTLTARKRGHKWDAYRELLFEPAITDRVNVRIREYNAVVARECGR
jgi:hypothetical protein